jgi:hypothetical protein
MHYHRWYRHGGVNKTARTSGVSVSQGRRYRSHHLPGHPLATPCGRVYDHQVVLYEAIGAGPHACHWCDRDVHWDATKGQPHRLTVDHLNGIGDDNRLANLVPSCPPCNSRRAAQARSAALVAAGWWSNHDTIAGLKARGRRSRVEAARTHRDSSLSVTSAWMGVSHAG